MGIPNLFFMSTIGLLAFVDLSFSRAICQNIEKTEFAKPSAARGETLFAKLDSSATNIIVDNAYDDPSMWGSRYREYMGGSMGSGVAVGDYDSDGLVDLFVSTKTKPGRLFRNRGGWKFEDVTEEAGLSEEGGFVAWVKRAVSSDEKAIWRHGAVFADVDNDGRLDLYVCRNDAPNLLYMNNGNGVFAEEGEKRGLNIIDGSVIGAFADYDRDGWLDALVLTNQIDGTEISGRADRLFRNTGDGNFVETTRAAGLSGATFGHSVIWFDYNDDKWPDFYIANDYAGEDYLYRNNGDGTFSNTIASVAPHISYSSMGIDTADVDNNGHMDLFIGDMAATSREKEKRRKPAASKEDLLKMGNKANIVPQYARNTLLLNTGLDYFREGACWAGIDATDWTWSVRFEDFDNDGWTDLHVTNGMVREANNSDILSRMMQARSAAQRVGAMQRSPRLEESNLAFRNENGEGFEPVAEEWGLSEVGVSFGAATADFDNDGDLDIAHLNHDGGVSVYRNDLSGRRSVQVRLRGKRSNRFGIGAVVRIESSAGWQSRALSTARGYSSGSEAVAHFGVGSDDAIKRLVVEWPSGVEQMYSDIPTGFAYEIEENEAEARSEEKQMESLFENRSESIGLKVSESSRLAIPDREQALLPFRTDRRGPGVAVADIDGDGNEDVFIAGTAGAPTRVLRWKEGVFVEELPSGIRESATEYGPPLLFDVDGDGARDLLLTKADSNAKQWPESFKAIIYSNDGSGGFTPTDRLPDLSMNVGAACVADIDGDGDLDLFLGGRSVPGRYPTRPRSAILRNDGGRYADATEGAPGLENVGLVKSALFRDVDMDGNPDLLVALEWDYVRYFHNEGDGSFVDWTERSGFSSGGRGWWNSLESGDFNGDGRLDFVAGNLGLNTPYEASIARPATLLYGRFGQSGPKVLIEAVYEGDTLYPLRAKGELSGRLARALRRFPRSDDYARASLEEVFGEKAIEDAERFSADNFSSGVFLSQLDGSYGFEPLPPQAQIGSIQGIAATDFDGDGAIDICATQNTDVATPSFHGGVGIFLKGRGDGSFAAIEPKESGILIAGMGRALVILDPADSANPSLFLTRLRGSSEFLFNGSGSGDRLKIRLVGKAPNLDAVGARIELLLSDGAKIRYEIGLGGGWLSQSVAPVFVSVSERRSVVEALIHWPEGNTTRHENAPAKGVWKIRQ